MQIGEWQQIISCLFLLFYMFLAAFSLYLTVHSRDWQTREQGNDMQLEAARPWTSNSVPKGFLAHVICTLPLGRAHSQLS